MADTAVQTARHRVVGLLVGEVVMFDLAIADQVFGRTDGYTWSVCGVRRGWLPTTTGLAVRVDHGLAALDEADTIVVPGIGDEAWPVPAAALRRLRAAHARGARVISVCTGAFVLAAAGLLDGRRATTHWRYAGLLASSFPAVEVDPAVLYVDHGTIATSAGLAAGIDLCLHLVARDLGADRAAAVARNMVVPPHRRGGQAQFVEALSATHEGTGLAEGVGLYDRPVRRAAHSGRPGSPGRDEPADVYPALPSADRSLTQAVAAGAQTGGGSSPAGVERPVGRRDRRPHGLRDTARPTAAVHPGAADDANGLPPHVRRLNRAG
jgi:putative intracellular protease/amidase